MRFWPKIFFKILLISFLLNIAGSCVPKLPEYKKASKENLKIPDQFPNQSNENKNSEDKNSSSKSLEQTKSNSEEDPVKKNWKVFFQQDPLLTDLIETALVNNQELKILDQEINIANNEVLARQGQYLPKVEIGAGYEAEKNSKNSKQGAIDNFTGLPDTTRNKQLGFNASWEVDIWGKLRNFTKSAYYNYLASIEGRNFAVTQLVSEIANSYYELMYLDNQLEIVGQYLKSLQESQKVVELQQIAGRTTSLAVRRFDAEVLKNESRIYRIKQQIVVTENYLNKILGRFPQPIKRASKNFKEIEMQEIAAEIPAKLLENRPDVKQASIKIEATNLNTESVKAKFYPSLNIYGNVGYQSFNSNHFIDPASLLYNVAGNLTAPLINRNAIKAEYLSANNQQIEAVYNYEKTFITAFTEVSNQLASVKNLDQIFKLKSRQAEALADSFDISNFLFKAAQVDYLESLLTRRDYLESQIELVEVKQQQLSAYVNLYKSLGGGWR